LALMDCNGRLFFTTWVTKMRFHFIFIFFIQFVSTGQILQKLYSVPPSIDLAGKRSVIFKFDSEMDSSEVLACSQFQNELEKYLGQSRLFKSDGTFEKINLRIQLNSGINSIRDKWISNTSNVSISEFAYIEVPSQNYHTSVSYEGILSSQKIAEYYRLSSNELPFKYVTRYVAEILAEKAKNYFQVLDYRVDIFLKPLQIKKLNFKNLSKLIEQDNLDSIQNICTNYLNSEKINQKEKYRVNYNLSVLSMVKGNLEKARLYLETAKLGTEKRITNQLEDFINRKQRYDSSIIEFQKRKDRVISPILNSDVSVYEEKESLPKQRFLLSAVGVDQFADDRIPELKYTYKDGELIYNFYNKLLRSKQDVLFSNLLGGKKATRANILKQLNETVNFSGEDDVNIFFFATHGQLNPVANELFFLTFDSDMDNIEGTALSQFEVQRIISRSRAKIKVIIIDACHSGIMNDKGFRSIAEETQGINRLIKQIGYRDKSNMIISSSSSSEKSLETEKLGQGVFTYFLVEGLEGKADANKNGLVTSREIFDYVYKAVSEYTKGKQHPEVSGEFDNFIPLSVILKTE